MRYPVILEPGSEGGYSVMVPDLPGCYSQGDTYEEAIDNAREAIELHLEGTLSLTTARRAATTSSCCC